MERKTYTKEEIGKKLEALPPNIRSLIYSTEMDTALQQVATKHQLHIDQMGILETETVDTLMGTESTDSFVERITESLEVDETKASAIAVDVNQLLFLKIRESMQNASEETPPPKPAAPAAVTQAPVVQNVPSAVATAPQMPVAERMLTQKTISTPSQSSAPTTYKTDPYREPPE